MLKFQLIDLQDPWNKGKLIGQKPPLKLQEIWAIRIRLQMANSCRDLALFNLAIDSKLRACDLIRLQVNDIAPNGHVASRAKILQRKTGHPVQFEITARTRDALTGWISRSVLGPNQPLFPSRQNGLCHLSTRQSSRLGKSWVAMIGLDPAGDGTHSMRRTKATLIYRQTQNIRAVQLLLGHTKLESTVRYLGIEVDDALEIAEQTEI